MGLYASESRKDDLYRLHERLDVAYGKTQIRKRKPIYFDPRGLQVSLVERFDSPQVAIDREKQIKKWRRKKKVRLIEEMNPGWDDLYAYLERDHTAQFENDSSASLRFGRNDK